MNILLPLRFPDKTETENKFSYYSTKTYDVGIQKNCRIEKNVKCSKILNSSWLQKRSRQTAQTQIRLLLKKQSDQVLPFLLF